MFISGTSGWTCPIAPETANDVLPARGGEADRQ